VFKREREKNRADGRASETGKEQITPSGDVDFAKLAEIREKQRQEHEQNQNVFPKDDHVRRE